MPSFIPASNLQAISPHFTPLWSERFPTLSYSIDAASHEFPESMDLGMTMNRDSHCLLLASKDISLDSPHSIDYWGFSSIYAGMYCQTRVAFKRIRSRQMDRDLWEKALAWRTLSHNHILPFIGIYSDDQHSFTSFVSRFMDNGTLSQWRKQNTPSASEIQEHILAVADGLQYLHSAGIVHGDIRGTNILLDNSFSVKIADFSLTLHSDATVTGNPALPFHFAAPELFPDVDDLDSEEESFEPTEKTDVYAFACLYYEIYFDVLPFGKNNMYVIGKKVKKGIRPEKRLDPPLNSKAWELIGLCWSQDPAKRPSMIEIMPVMMSWHLRSRL